MSFSPLPCYPTATCTVLQESQPGQLHRQVAPSLHPTTIPLCVMDPPQACAYTTLRQSSNLSRAIVKRVYLARRKPLHRFGEICCHNLFPVILAPAASRRPLPPHDLHQGTQCSLLNQAGLWSEPDMQVLLGRSWRIQRCGENICCSRRIVDRLIASPSRLLQRKLHLQGPLGVNKIEKKVWGPAGSSIFICT
jgi:hypothetical protein